MKPKNKYEEVTKSESTSIKEIERDFKIHRILTWVLIIISLAITLSNLKLQAKNLGLKEENNRLVEVIENLKFGGN